MGIWDLELVWDLGFEAWDLGFQTTPIQIH
jgi:hypothetical protein